MKLRVLIAEDELLCRERLRKFLESEPMADIVADCTTGHETLDAIQRLDPDIVFLDIRMPGLDAFEIIDQLKGLHSPAIIFVTASDRFALKAFELQAADYLLKPFDRMRLQIAFQRGCECARKKNAQGKQSGAEMPPDCETTELERIAVKSQDRIIILKTKSIEWICSSDNYVELHVQNATHVLRTTIKALQNRLSQNQFMRISRSLLVNVEHIKEIHPKTHGDFVVLLANGTQLNGSRNFRQGLEELCRSH